MKKTLELVIVVILLLPSCSSNDGLGGIQFPTMQLIIYNAQSRADGPSMKFQWNKIENAKTYTLEFSKDSLLFSNELQTIELGDTLNFEMDSLLNNTNYSARIKAFDSTGKLLDSHASWGKCAENIFVGAMQGWTSGVSSISTDRVALKWTKYVMLTPSKIISEVMKVTRIVAISSDGTVIETILNQSEVLAAQKVIIGLSSGIQYRFEIYQGDMIRGFTTGITN
ncbi:MAG: hypothetical protein GZ091_08250 [Paludibacter sp.]|nr:hypothetical protein [Paludibacter sp.]